MALAFQVTKQGIQLVEPRIRRLDAVRGRTFSAASTLLFELMQLGVYLVPQLRDAEPAGLGIKVRLPHSPWASAVLVCTPWAAPLVLPPHVCTTCVHHLSGPLVLALHLLAPLVIANFVCSTILAPLLLHQCYLHHFPWHHFLQVLVCMAWLPPLSVALSTCRCYGSGYCQLFVGARELTTCTFVPMALLWSCLTCTLVSDRS